MPASDHAIAIALPDAWPPSSEVTCTTKERSPKALAEFNHSELTAFLRSTSPATTPALLEAAALCDRELGIAVVLPVTARRCDGCAKCAYRKCPTTPARGRRS